MSLRVVGGPPMPPPKFATKRDLSRRTIGGRQGKFARDLLGQPFMPHQQLIADVSGEVDEDGLPVYPLVVVTMQRQAGKSHLSLSQSGERSFSVPGYRSWYTAQTGQDARDQFLKFDEENIAQHPLRHFVHIKRGKGEEVLEYPNGSKQRPHPPTEEKLHGKQSDRNDIDEAWAFATEEGKALQQAIAPTQLTRPGAQTFIWSAGGTAASTWLAELVARGRAGEPGLAYFEWGIPDDLDVNDLEALAQHHPAYGRTISAASLRTLRVNLTDDAEFARAAGNRWTEIIGGAISAGDWQAIRFGDAVPDAGRIGYGAARAADGSEVAIVAAIELPDGRVVVEVLEVLPTAYRAAERVKGWATDGPLAVAPAGPSGALAAELQKLKTRRLLTLTESQASAAVVNLLDSLEPRGVLFRQHPALDAAQQVAGVRNTGDGGKAWARTQAGASIAALEAAGLAVWALATAPKSSGKPRLISPSRAA